MSVVFDQFPDDSVAMDPDAFDSALRNHGVKMIHWRSMKCPVGMADPHDIRRAHDHHEACSNGYIYRKAGILTALFTGNAKDSRLLDPGFIDGSSARITLPRFYDDHADKTIHIAYADRFYLAEGEAEVADWHTFAAHTTGVDRLQFPAKRVEHVIDSAGREYDPSLYTVSNGNLKWLTADRPSPGVVCTSWYLYQPFWFCSRLVNEIRVTQVVDGMTGESKIERLPYSAVITRENVFRSEENDDKTPDSPRKQTAAADGGFGAR